MPLDSLISVAPGTPAITDDRPVNEYYILRKWFRVKRALGVSR